MQPMVFCRYFEIVKCVLILEVIFTFTPNVFIYIIKVIANVKNRLNSKTAGGEFYHTPHSLLIFLPKAHFLEKG